ncbi:MAG: DUF5657 family protein [Candidatus Shapirobacteria bacterium]
MLQINTLMLLAGKLFAILGTILYFIFSIVIVKQVTSMSSNVYDKFNAILIAFSYLHLLFSILLIILAIVFL